MPLYKRKPFPLLERPNDLKPEELVFQVRFTKEIFRDYGEYLYRINLYRQRVWTCKVTGKINLTYEEALVSEKKATEKVQQFPEELVEHVLRDVQFSHRARNGTNDFEFPFHPFPKKFGKLPVKTQVTNEHILLITQITSRDGECFMGSPKLKHIRSVDSLSRSQPSEYFNHRRDTHFPNNFVPLSGTKVSSVEKLTKKLKKYKRHSVYSGMLTLKDLVNTIAMKLQEHVLEGSELYGRKNNRIYPCKIVKVLKDEDSDKTQYQVAWLDKDKKITSNAVVVEEDLIKKKLPFTREVLKSFIRESTYRSVPWVLHDKLASMHGIPTKLPEELKDIVFLEDGFFVNVNRKRKKTEGGQKNGDNEEFGNRKRKKMGEEVDSSKTEEKPIKYPIDDLLVRPAADDPVFTPRPFLCLDFNVPMDCVGDLLMVWDFCSSFSKLLNLWPFSLEDFENALCHKESNLVLIVECHSAFLLLLMKDNGDYSATIQQKKRKPKISLVTWTEYLCDFLELSSVAELSTHISTIRRGHYGLLDIHSKLGIFRALVDQVLETDVFREKLNEYIEERQALAATKRGEALEEGRKRREDKERSKIVDVDDVSSERISVEPENHTHNTQNGCVTWKQTLEKRLNGNNQVNGTLKKHVKKQKVGSKITTDGKEDSSKKGVKKLIDDGKTESPDKMSKEQRPKKQRRQSKSGKENDERKEYLEREMDKRFVRTSPLGKDRNYNRYWFFRRDARIFVETSDSEQWGYYSTKEEVDALMGSLNEKGEREHALKKQLKKCYDTICTKLQKRCKEVAQRTAMEEAEVRRSTRVRAPPRDKPSLAFRNYVNKCKEE